MKPKKTILIFGISSFVGSSLAEILKEDYRIIGTYYKTPVNIEGVLTLKCDVNEKDLVQKIVFLFKPDITVYSVGLTDLNACQEHSKVADALNTAGVFNVSSSSERYQSKFIYFSSSYIFSGENTLFRENDTPMPSSVYGNTVASSEFYIQKSCLNYLIFRCAPIIGRSYNPNDLNWMEVIERCNFLNEKIVCDTKVRTGFIDVWTFAEVFKRAIEGNITNRLFQVSSTNITNRYEFAKLFLEKFGGNTSLLFKGDWEFPRTENQLALQSLGEELNFQMDTDNVEETLELKMPTVEEVVEKIYSKLSGSAKTKRRMQKATGVSFI